MLGKKSWNVYNKDNIERVKRDEDEARLAQQREERRQHNDEAADRLDLLRQGQDDAVVNSERPASRKRLRDDVDRPETRPSKHQRRDKDEEDFGRGSRDNRRAVQKSDDPLDNITNMRFRDAGGRGKERPWYSSLDPTTKADTVGRDVWGNEDAGRESRDQNRLVINDPLLAMKRGVKQLKESEKQKAEWRRERERDLNEVEQLARRDRRYKSERESRRKHRSRDREHHRTSSHRHRPRSRSPRRSD